MATLNQKSTAKCLAGGTLEKYFFAAQSTSCDMTFQVYFPPSVGDDEPLPFILFLGGLTCNEDNFFAKSGAFAALNEHGIACVAPDTSPRVDIPGDSESWDLGKGASYYVDSSQDPWKKHYQMDSFVTQELLAQLKLSFGSRLDFDRVSIMGHSVGGHGSLVLGLRNPDLFRSISAFAPMVSPSRVPWGQKAFKALLGSVAAGASYDAELLAGEYSGRGPLPIRIDQGSKDQFYEKQLNQSHFLAACEKNQKLEISYTMHDGYDHSYYFVASFVAEHITFHAKYLKK